MTTVDQIQLKPFLHLELQDSVWDFTLSFTNVHLYS